MSEAKKTFDPVGFENVEIFGAREHNLKNISLSFPRNKLVVITGISGSGKSSLAFDTIYAEGQRRYMESFSAYARSFIGNMERPDVDKINGLSPVISIEQKTTSRNPRSTVGTLTEIYDFLRLLYARAGHAYSYKTGKRMISQTEDQIINLVCQNFPGQKASLLAPLVRGRKGHYRDLFQQLRKSGYAKVRIDGEILDLVPKMQIDRYKIHDIELVVDRIKVPMVPDGRLIDSVRSSLDLGKGVCMLLDQKDGLHYFSKQLMDPETGLAYDKPAPNLFSFNSPRGYCPSCKGLGTLHRISKDNIIPNPKLSIAKGGIAPLGLYRDTWIFKKIDSILKIYKSSIKTPLEKLPPEVIEILLYGSEDTVEVESVKYPGTAWKTSFEGIIAFMEKQRQGGTEKMRAWVEDFMEIKTCGTCDGQRLRKQALNFKIGERNIAELAEWDIATLSAWLSGVEEKLDAKQKIIGTEVLKEVRKRVGFLMDVGLDYLSLNRPLRSLSGGEAQRIRLATQIGTQLVGVLYIMDEPSIGLHQRDNQKLIAALKNLRDIGNSVIVVEHDKDMMLASDFIIDIGPGAGRHGGHIVAAGTPEEVLAIESQTSDYLSGKKSIPVPKKRRSGNGNVLKLKGAKGNNLKKVNADFPLGQMICVTGVSGSGKSTLIHDTLFPLLSQKIYKSRRKAMAYKEIIGLEHLDKVIEVDQSPIGRTPRSNPATYTGLFTHIRSLFADLPEAKIRGYKAGRFSFNVKGGRCETCQGGGLRTVEMDFLPNVYVVCEDCKGKRYNRETLEVRFKGKSISDVLDMTIESALDFFEFQPRIKRIIQTLADVGLGYISLGQHATTLSGGEAQRVKLSTELSKRDTGSTFYILDEPSTGLHFEDIRKLMDVLSTLVDKGNTVLIVEHNLDIIKLADYIIDMGPEGGSGGGMVVAKGTPEQIAKNKKSYTGLYLKDELKKR